jgi:signal transduction histidine kinase
MILEWSLFLIIIILNLILGFLVLFKNPKKEINKLFFWLVIFIVLWITSNYLENENLSISLRSFFLKLDFALAPFLALSFLFFCISFSQFLLKKHIKFILLIIAGLLSLFSFSDYLIKNITILGETIIFNTGILFPFYYIFLIFIVFFGCYKLIICYRKSSGLKKVQSLYILFGLSLTSFFVLTLNLILPQIIFIPLSIGRIGIHSLIIFIFVSFYAIFKYRLMDISLIIGRGIIYIFSFSSVIGINFYLFFLNNKLAYPISLNILGPLIIALSILLFQLFFNLYEKISSRYFYYTFYSYQKVLNDLGEKITKILDLNTLTSLIVDTLIETMKLDRAVILMREQDGHYAILKNIGFKQENDISLVTDNFLTKYLQKRKKPLVYEEVSLIQKDSVLKEEKRRLEKLKDNMNKIEADICLPLFRENKIIGIIVLGKKVSGDAYSKEDIDLLVALSNQASIALENARLYERIEDLSENLQEKVDQQTKELKQAYNKIERAYEVEKKAHQELKSLSEAKNQFILATQHHLRTPLTIMKGYSSMLIEGDYGKLNKKAKEKLVFFSESTQKLINLVNEFLDISQFQVGKKILKMEKVDVQKLVKDVIKEFKIEAEKKGLYLEFKKLNRIPMIKADYAKLREAIYNIVNNGIKYTEKGGITIFLEMKNKRLKIMIQDTGIGIGKKEINSLFEKTFERSKGAQKLYTLGRGIGLYISSSIIKAHNGKIWAESSGENSGSIFHIELPIK